MFKTPPPKKIDDRDSQADTLESLDDPSNLKYPSGRIGALTRKKNEILNLLDRQPPPEVNVVMEQYSLFGGRADRFYEICDRQLNKENVDKEYLEKFKDWKEKSTETIAAFRAGVSKWIQDHTEEAVNPAAIVHRRQTSQKSYNSNSSKSLKENLAQQRAKRKTEEMFQTQRESLEQKKLDLDQQMRRMNLMENRELENNLEMEVCALENDSSNGSLSSRSVRSNRVRNFVREASQNGLWANVSNRNIPVDACTKFEVKPPPQFDFSRRVPAVASQDSSTLQLKDVLSKQNEITLMLARSQDRSLLPKNEPPVFDGTDLTLYRPFLRAFKMTIEDRCGSLSDALYYLEKYTAGSPRELVRSCLGDDSGKGYKQAIDLLEKRYGDEYKIADCYLKKIEKWPFIKSEDGKSLEEFSIFLSSCLNCMSNISGLNQLNSPKEIMEIIRKLPYRFREKWRNHTHILRKNNKHIEFKELVAFIEEQSTIINIPIFGDIKDDHEKHSSRFSSSKNKSFSTRVEGSKDLRQEEKSYSTRQSCICCKKENHVLENCFHFGKKTNDERVRFLREQNLCFACLSSGHRSAGCLHRLTCSKCKKKHPTCLHVDNYVKKEETMKKDTPKIPEEDHELEIEEDANKESHESSVHAIKRTNFQNGTGALQKSIHAVLPVKIRMQGSSNFVITYMGLDTFCSDSFMDERLLNKLGIKGRRTTINLTTMEGVSNKHPSQVLNNLEVCDLDENERTFLPVVYSKTNWPFTKKDSPNPKDIENYDYLQEIPFRYVDAEIGILVGASMPGILKPLRIVDREEHEPYASLHKFGWALTGNVTVDSRPKAIMCNNVKIDHDNLDFKIQKFFEQDFKYSQDDVLGPSMEDLKWQEIISSSLKKLDNGHFELALPFRNRANCFPSNRDRSSLWPSHVFEATFDEEH